MATRIFFEKDDSLVVDEILGDAEQAIADARNHASKLAKLTRNEEAVLVNAEQIRYLIEYDPSDVRVHVI